MDTIRDMIAAQRAELAEVLAGLPGPSAMPTATARLSSTTGVGRNRVS